MIEAGQRRITMGSEGGNEHQQQQEQPRQQVSDLVGVKGPNMSIPASCSSTTRQHHQQQREQEGEQEKVELAK